MGGDESVLWAPRAQQNTKEEVHPGQPSALGLQFLMAPLGRDNCGPKSRVGILLLQLYGRGEWGFPGVNRPEVTASMTESWDSKTRPAFGHHTLSCGGTQL